jgi:CheY-like chemotaxis protein
MPSCDGLQATQLIRRLEDQHQRGWGGEPAADSCSDSPRSSDSGARRVPIIAVSACSEADQLLSPALAEVADPTGARRRKPHGAPLKPYPTAANPVAPLLILRCCGLPH